MALHFIEMCAGVGMLGEGAGAAFELLGHEHRTVCYVEREAAAAAQLVALMEAGAIDPAPVWSDLLTFDSPAWRGCVDLIVASFPCQDLSIAGRRAGLNGERSGLFFDILDHAYACGAWGLVLENVAGIATATASVMDEAEGALEERAAARVLGELADRGWHAEWLPLSASDVGASHGRARWFCFAWRMADAGHGTPRDRIAGGSRSQEPEGGARPLQSVAEYWMTPSVSNSHGNEYARDRGQAGDERLTLTGQAQHWPTPTASLVNDGEDPTSWNARRQRTKDRIGNGNGMGMPLTQAAQQWPTPASRDFRTPNSQESQESRTIHGGEQLPNFVEHHFSLHPVLSTLDGGPSSPTARTLRRRLNPAFGCWLMGWPIWWTNPGLTSCARSATASWRSRLRQELSSCCGAPALLEQEAA